MTLTPLRPRSPADSTRAAQLVAQMRTALARYRDVRAAEADGFRRFLPGVKQPIYHFTSWRWALRATRRFDPTKPTSLLYREGPGGTLVLAGAMYTAPARTSLDALDQRIPLSVARWHEHVNWCLPPRGQRERWRETRDGKPPVRPQVADCDGGGVRSSGRAIRAPPLRVDGARDGLRERRSDRRLGDGARPPARVTPFRPPCGPAESRAT